MQVQLYKYSELTKKIIGYAMKVHRYFGAGFPEVVYQRALMIEFKRNDLDAWAEVEKDVLYYGEFVGKRRIDIIVDEKVLVELKAISELDKDCYNQVLNCLNVFNYEVGLLLNFGQGSLQVKRFVRSVGREEE